MPKLVPCRLCKNIFNGTLFDNCVRILSAEHDNFIIICQQCEVDYLIPRFIRLGSLADEPEIKIYQTLIPLIEAIPEYPDFMDD